MITTKKFINKNHRPEKVTYYGKLLTKNLNINDLAQREDMLVQIDNKALGFIYRPATSYRIAYFEVFSYNTLVAYFYFRHHNIVYLDFSKTISRTAHAQSETLKDYLCHTLLSECFWCEYERTREQAVAILSKDIVGKGQLAPFKIGKEIYTYVRLQQDGKTRVEKAKAYKIYEKDNVALTKSADGKKYTLTDIPTGMRIVDTTYNKASSALKSNKIAIERARDRNGYENWMEDARKMCVKCELGLC